MKHPLTFAVAVGLAVTGCAGNPFKPGETGGAAQQATEVRTTAYQGSIDAIQVRLDRLKGKAALSARYPLAKAQCWLDTALNQYSENDRTGYPDEALAESKRILEAVEVDDATRVGFSTPFIARSSKIRADLWAQLDAHKSREATLACNALSVACGEVSLVRAGHALDQTGWRQAAPHVSMAENALRRAALEAGKCNLPKASGDSPTDSAALAIGAVK